MFHLWSQNLWLIIEVCQQDHRQIPLRCHPNPRDQSENSPVTLTSWPRFCFHGSKIISYPCLTWAFSPLCLTLFTSQLWRLEAFRRQQCSCQTLCTSKEHQECAPSGPCGQASSAIPPVAHTCDNTVFIAKMRVIKIYMCVFLSIFFISQLVEKVKHVTCDQRCYVYPGWHYEGTCVIKQ